LPRTQRVQAARPTADYPHPTFTYAQIIANAKQKRKDKHAVALCAACAKGDIDALRRLMAVADVDLDSGDYDDRRPIHLAACTGNITAIQMLTAARADVNVRDRMGSTPLHEALVHKQAEAATLLISTGAERLYSQIADRLCYVSSLADGVEELRYLVAFETRSVSATNYDGRTGLHLAAAEGRVETVRLLVENGASVNARDKRGCTPLLVSALSSPR
jgi:ankyrin repeat protein